MARLVVVWLHVVAATAWVGGLLYASHLVLPGLARGDRGYVPLLTRGRLVAWTALGVLVLTGLENLRRVSLESYWLMGKLLLVLGLLALAAHRDFALLPRLVHALERGEDSAAAVRGLRVVDHVLLLLALAVLFLAVGVARGR